MTLRILPAVADPDVGHALATLLDRLPEARLEAPAADSTALLDRLGRSGQGPDGFRGAAEALPEVVLVHERIGPAPALELITEITQRFPTVGVVLLTTDPGPATFAAAMDARARGLVALPLTFDELAARVTAAGEWAAGLRAHLGGQESAAGPPSTLVTVSGAKGGVGTTVTAVQLALAALAQGRSVALVDLDLQAGDVGAYLDVRFRRSIADLAGIRDVSPRVLQDVLHRHHTGLDVLLAPENGERGEEVDDRTARQVLAGLRARHAVVVADCGSQMQAANAAAVELADTALLVTTPDVVSVRAAKRQVGLWERLRVRRPETTTTVVNRLVRSTEITPALVARTTGTTVTRTHVPAGFRELQPHVDAGRMQDLDGRSAVRQALWTLAEELGLGHDRTGQGPRNGGRGNHRARPTLTGRRGKALPAAVPPPHGPVGPHPGR
ncbi:CpaE family protein [Streptomyces sp. NPDC059740]|uniref:AAA family ATPase n=1 Tax=Streptomyces sp. NPDC059740 TaxID=3346926 RepID=UPI00364BD1A9